MTLEGLLIFAAVYAVAIATPGPGIVALVARALGSGFWATVPMTFGMLAGDIVWMALSAFGLTLVAQAMGELFIAIKIVGALYLVWLGWKYWTTSVSNEPEAPVAASRGFFAMFGLTLGNPKAAAFFVALLPTVVDLKTISVLGFGEIVLTACVVLPIVTLTYAALASWARGLFASVTARRRMNKGAGVVMMGAGLGVAVS